MSNVNKCFFLVFLFITNFYSKKISSQDTLIINIKPNQKPTFFNQFRLIEGVTSPNNARVDIFDKNVLEKVGIPNNYAGFQEAIEQTENYLGIITYNSNTTFNLKEKVEYGIDNNQFNEIGFVQFLLPYGLGKKKYHITYKVSLADNSRFATSGWGAYLSTTELKNSNNLHSTIKPQVSSNLIIKDKLNWVEFKEKYTSTGDEKYLTIGCFNQGYKKEEVLNAKDFGLTRAYYYLTDIKLIEIPDDTDEDGIIDIKDKCPLVFGDAKHNGCPDTDLDSIPDYADDCPMISGLRKFNGCPDTDGDGVEDSKDKCPTIAGVAENNGCLLMSNLDYEKKVILLLKNIVFEDQKFDLTQTTKTSLDEAAEIIKTNDLKNITIDEFYDAKLSEKENIKLSNKRTSAILNYLISNGCNVNSFVLKSLNIPSENNTRRIEVEVVNPK